MTQLLNLNLLVDRRTPKKTFQRNREVLFQQKLNKRKLSMPNSRKI